jgi:hypothetical protein
MKNNVARFFLEEIGEWTEQIEKIQEEVSGIEKTLESIVRQNTITGIAAATEAHQNLLDKQIDVLGELQDEFNKQEMLLNPDGKSVKNGSLTTLLRNRQHLLRKKMKKAGKEYIDIKYSCHEFVSNMLK